MTPSDRLMSLKEVAEPMRILKKGSAIPMPKGPLMSSDAVATELFGGLVSAKWVRSNVPNKVKLGHSTVAFYRDDVLAFIESRKESAA